MSEPVIFIGVVEIDDYDKGWIDDTRISENFGSLESLIQYLNILYEQGNRTPRDVESVFV